MLNLKGMPINQGIVEGSVFIKVNPIQALQNKKYSAVNVSLEIEKYLTTIVNLQQEFQEIKVNSVSLSTSINQQMADLYCAILNDPIFKIKVPELIKQTKIPATHALIEQMILVEQEFAKINNEYFRSRFEDFRSIEYKILENLLGSGSYDSIKKPKIIVAEYLSAVDLLHLPLEYILGVITSSGGTTSHAAILAEALNIPAIFGVEGLIEHINPKDVIIMDGYVGDVILYPTAETSLFYKKLSQQHLQYEQKILESAKDCHTSKDGHPMSIMANIGNAYDVPLIHKYHADGIGLLRTETMVLLEEALLTQKEQTLYYQSILKETKGLPVCVRTLDLGGDKTIKDSTVTPLDEDNPFLGFRSTRLFVQDPTEFINQITALFVALPANPNIKILIPFITTLEDFLNLKSVILQTYQKIYRKPCPLPIGMMAEVPSTLICIKDFIPHVDFISIGTNDLTQYILATDRNNVYVSHYHTPSHPAIIKLLADVAKQCKSSDIPLSVCGEMAKEPHFVRLLYGLGINTLSMSPSGIPMARYILANSTLKECRKIAQHVKTLQHSYQIDEFLQNDLTKFLQSQDAYFDSETIPSVSNTKRAR